MSKQSLIDQLDQAIDQGFFSANPEIAELLRSAHDLRHLPRTAFKATLKADLERKAIEMSAKKEAYRPVFHSVTPYLLLQNLEHLDFLKRVFNAEELFRAELSPGRIHTEIRVGDTILMAGSGSGSRMPMTFEIFVPNADEVIRKAIDAGALPRHPINVSHWHAPEPEFRFGSVEDQEGNIWVISTCLGSDFIPPSRHTVSLGFVVKGAAQFVAFLKEAFGGSVSQKWEWPDGYFASVEIGTSVVGVSEAANHEWMHPMPGMVQLRVPNVDEVYGQAVRSGAKAGTPVADQPYGVRTGSVEDAWGNHWFIATPLT